MPGHLFIAQGDLTRLACDAWLLPTDRFGNVASGWLDSYPALDELTAGLRGNEELAGGKRVTTLQPSAEGLPGIWAVDTGGSGAEPTSWFAEGIEAGLSTAVGALPRKAANGRNRPLVAMPLFGIGEGKAPFKGEVVLAQVELILRFLKRTRRLVDVVILAADELKLAAAQQARDRGVRALGIDAWPDLDASERKIAGELAGLAQDGGLVLFIGAGVSSAAGLPGWSTLLRQLASEAGIPWNTDFKALDPLDQGRLIRRTLKPEPFGRIMQTLFSDWRFQSLAHQMLASLPITEAATTNYDTLFEEAWRFGGRDVAVLPRKRKMTEGRWLLKLHGTITNPSTVVLTRDEYLRLDREGPALSGIVQAMLITKKMLFVGYSLTDDRFHRIAHDARSAVGSSEERPGAEPFGIALSPTDSPSLRRLWEKDIRILDMSAGDNKEVGARRIELFLDYLLAQSHDAGIYLQDPAFEALWSPNERHLAQTLAQAWRYASTESAGPAASAVARAIRKYSRAKHGQRGGRPPSRDSD